MTWPNSAHWHLILNHFPVVGTILGIFLVALVFVQKSKGFEFLALWWFVMLAVLAIPVYLTGEPAEELVEGLAGVSHDAIEQHEQWAMWAFTMQELTGLFAFSVILYRNLGGEPGTWIQPVLLGLVLITAGLMSYTASLGGQIHHPEIRPGFTPPEEHEEHEEANESASRSDPKRYPGSVELICSDPSGPPDNVSALKHVRAMFDATLHVVRGRPLFSCPYERLNEWH